MRHRRKGRVLGRSPSHQRALKRNLAAAIFLTERDAEGEDNAPKVKGRIITTIEKAKEVRPLVERCITIAIRSTKHAEAARPYAPPTEPDGSIDRTGEAYRAWKKGDDAQKFRKFVSAGHRSSPTRLLYASRPSGHPNLLCRCGAAIRRPPGGLYSYSAAGQTAPG